MINYDESALRYGMVDLCRRDQGKIPNRLRMILLLEVRRYKEVDRQSCLKRARIEGESAVNVAGEQ